MSETMLDINRAARELGLPNSTVQQAIIFGRLPAIKVKAQTSRGIRPIYLIAENDLHTYAEYRSAKKRPTVWAEDMDAALLELVESCTLKQIAAYLGVTDRSAKSRLRRIGGQKRGRIGRPMNPFTLPKTGVLLAKTCTKCGELKGASDYYNRKGVSRVQFASECRLCTNKANRNRNHRKLNYRKVRKALQDHTMECATRHRQEWTTAEDEILSNTTKSTYLVALELGRTLNAVWDRRQTIGIAKQPMLQSNSGNWEIDFPATQQEIEDYFRSLGPVSEEFWEWND